MNPRMILLGLAGCLLAGMFAVASAGSLMPSARSADAAGAPSSAASGSVPVMGATAVAVAASDLWLAYNRDPAQADLRFKDRPLLVTGSVRSVDRDFEGRMLVRLNTGDAYDTVNARMALRNDPAAIGIVKGRQVSLSCVGRGALIGAPQLGDCAVR
jgi:hypothetical protein